MVGPVLVLIAWQLACTEGVFTSVEVASPIAVLDAARELWSQDVLQSNMLISLQRVAEGLVLGVATGVALAVLCGLFWVGEDLIDPVIQAARAVPILGLVPLVIIWFGVGEFPKVFLIALGCMFPVYINTYAAIRGVDVKLVEAGQTFGLTRAWPGATGDPPRRAARLPRRPALRAGRLLARGRGGGGDQRAERPRLPHQPGADHGPHRHHVPLPRDLRDPRPGRRRDRPALERYLLVWRRGFQGA